MTARPRGRGAALGHGHDSSEHHRAASSAALARREAGLLAQAELARLKDEFLGTVSHELRTPLQSVSGYAQLAQRWLQRSGADPDLAHLIERIVLSTGQLTRMVNQLLDFAELEQGTLAVHVADADLTPVLRAVADGLQGEPGAERLVVVLPASLLARADRARVAQVTTSLLANALSYAPEGPITLRARHLPSGAVRIVVQDCGPGVPPAARQRVWERFSRGPDALVSAPRGLGIGLAMVKSLVEAQGGRVGLASAPGGGSRFWFELAGSP